MQAIGRYTLRVRLRYPFADFPKTLGTVVTAVTPVDYIRSVGQKAYERRPVGTGPYMVQSWTAHQSIDLVRNPTYWDTADGGYVDRIQFRIFSGAEAMWRQFQAGGLDMTEVPEGQILTAQNDPNVASGKWSAVMWPRLSVTMIGIDMKDPVLGAPGGATGALLRQALALATDQNAVCNVVDDGVPVPASGLVPPGVPGYRSGQSPYVYDPDTGREAGGSDGEEGGLRHASRLLVRRQLDRTADLRGAGGRLAVRRYHGHVDRVQPGRVCHPPVQGTAWPGASCSA